MVPFIWHFIKKQPIAFAVVLAAGIIWSLNEMLFPYFLKWIINTVSNYHGNPQLIVNALKYPLILLAFFWLCMEIAMRTQGVVLIYLFPRFRCNIRETVFDYIKNHSHKYFSENFSGGIAKKLSELPSSCQSITEIVFFNCIPIFLSFLIAFVLMASAKPLFGFILLGWFILHMAFSFIFMRVNDTRWAAHSKSVSTLTGKIVDIITNMLTVRLFARSKYEGLYLKRYQEDEINKSQQALWTVELMRMFQSLSALIYITAIIFTLIHGWIKGWVSIGDFSLIGTLSFWILGMVWYMSYQLMVFIRESASVNEALSLITIGYDVKDKSAAYRLVVNKGEIIFKNITFNYHQGKKIFNNFNVTINPGQKIGLVGFSGSGKSTFVNLLLRFYDVAKGQIFIDNQNIAEVSQDSLREQIAMIPQEPTLFHRTIKDNILYGKLNASDEEILTAAKLAHCHEFIMELPEGYNTLVGERGIKLSGGQKQRIAIARAILKNAPILILDEATSSLDSVTEKYIQESLQELMFNKTTIVIAHRLSTLADMDRILVFNNGRIVEDGTATELLSNEGHFATLWQMQKDGFLAEEIN